MDYTNAEALLRRLLKLSPAHTAGILQLARLLADVHFSRAKITETADNEKILDEICSLYERSVAANKEVLLLLYYYFWLY